MAIGRSPHRDLVKSAYIAWDREDWAEAGRLLEQAVRAAPDQRGSERLWFDAALAYKFLRDWPKAYELGREAAARSRRGAEDPAFWNLGIAATALRDWATARDCWAGYGLDLPPGTGEITADLGPTCVRIDTRDGQEVVWAVRLCPARARVISVPFDPGRRFGEIVLHDGAPNGERVAGGRTHPVFDELLLFESSPTATLAATVTARTGDDLRAAAEAFQLAGFGAEPLDSADVLCRCCSEGTREVADRFGAGEQQLLVAAPEERAVRLLDAWAAADPAARSWRDLHPAT
ncbi:hypothetical protein [Spirilliplanes yamanashiensis]|uniref:Tetratricopeptide repeat protein n=1 Tax=Spirilliplanes yamanashiensis TaxID=42233 RepID=A0A8J3YBF6_9ACTN|nr:hypothetical protein [Spirilliplanes yamanashiensis]MDP9819023.1 tetratricopeptide (TPR) repeat protein [Spirilliplanes yamanashiensis]GIJ05478.1 hypothetical protein Sya03_48300 [Spirilliplanes yamanashiensis]